MASRQINFTVVKKGQGHRHLTEHEARKREYKSFWWGVTATIAFLTILWTILAAVS